MTSLELMMDKVTSAEGFIAALDQSGGSTPKALKAYGVPDDNYFDNEVRMHDLVHEMRTRIITSKSFNGDRVIGAILFEKTMDRLIERKLSAKYLWENKSIVPFLKVDKGMEAEKDGVQLMKPMHGLDRLLIHAKGKGIFGTKMRSFIKTANPVGIKAIVDQQFEIAKQISALGLVPIIEPEVDIKSPQKEECEDMLKANILEHLNKLGDDQKVMLKLTLPSKVNFYKDCIDHPKTIRVVALSGGYSRDEACKILAKQTGMIASFSRALAEGLSYGMSDDDFDKTLDASIQTIYDASNAGE